MLKFECIVELKEGYRPVMQTEEETEAKFVIEAKNRATAERMVQAMIKGSPNIKDWGIYGMEEIDNEESD